MSMTWLANGDFDTAWAHHPTTSFGATSDRSAPLAILPIFGFADHGLGLALDVEETVGAEVLRRASHRAKQTAALRVLPPLRFGLAPYASCFFGVDVDTASAMVREICRGVKAAGMEKLVFVVTSPWQHEWVQAVSLDVRVELALRTFVLPLAGVGLSFHPTSSTRPQLQAIGAHLLNTTPALARPGSQVEPEFRPGRWDQPPPVDPLSRAEPERWLDAAAEQMAALLLEMVAFPHASAPSKPTAEAAPRSDPPLVWPAYRSRYLGALSRDKLEGLPHKAEAFVILPTASVEQHGPHLPVGVDAILGQAWLSRALDVLPSDLPVWVSPPITYGKSIEHIDFPGTLTLSGRTLRQVLLAQARQLHALGFRQLGIFNTHGGNSAVLQYTLREIQTTFGLRAGVVSNPYRPALPPDEATFGFHAGDWETSLMLACAGRTVDMKRAVTEFPARVNDPGQLRPEAAPAVFSWMTRDISRSGVMGDARAATREKGERWLAESSHALAQRIIQLVNTNTGRAD